jgi:hypothetical protein
LLALKGIVKGDRGSTQESQGSIVIGVHRVTIGEVKPTTMPEEISPLVLSIATILPAIVV